MLIFLVESKNSESWILDLKSYSYQYHLEPIVPENKKHSLAHGSISKLWYKLRKTIDNIDKKAEDLQFS